MSAKTEGWVYIASNPAMPGLVKIGFTSRDPDERLSELGKGTGVPDRFRLEYSEHVVNCQAAEAAVHLELSHYRSNASREFFAMSPRRAIVAVASICESMRTDIGRELTAIWVRKNGVAPTAQLQETSTPQDRPTRIIVCPGCQRRLRIPKTMQRY